MKTNKFEAYKLGEEVLRALSLMEYHEPTEVQKQTIPVIKREQDLVIKSETGSGKTAAFAIPIIDVISWEENSPQVLVLTPTRELAQQVREEMFNIGRFKRMKVLSIFGKTPIKSQIKDLKQKTHIVTGTPGRILDHIKRETLDLSKIKFLVLDEADEMLNMGFVEQINEILKALPLGYNMTLLSATMPKDVSDICHAYMSNPEIIEIEKKTTQNRIEQVRYDVQRRDKMKLLLNVTTVENPDSCIIFCNKRVEVDAVHQMLEARDYPCQKLHGGMEQDVRTKTMNDFRKGYFRYLVATDVAARGIDIEDISLVLNYDLPDEAEVYVHRIGRTGRKDKLGKAISFVTNREHLVREIEALTTIEMKIVEHPTVDEIADCEEAFTLKLKTKPVIKEEKHKELNQGIMKLHINAGKKTKMRAGDIVGAICNIEGLTQDDIGNISITDVSTFFEILNDKGNTVLKEFKTTPIKGRLRNVSKANS